MPQLQAQKKYDYTVTDRSCSCQKKERASKRESAGVIAWKRNKKGEKKDLGLMEF